MLTRTLIQNEARQSREQMRLINEAVETRRQNRESWQKWEEACRVWHETPIHSFYLWSAEAKNRMREGDREVVEDALIFLEVDPWFFRSGYLKERILSHLKAAKLNRNDIDRLRNIITNATRGKCGREFHYHCRLSVRVWTPQWEAQMREEARTPPPTSHGKHRRLLEFWDSQRDKLREDKLTLPNEKPRKKRKR